MTRVPVFEKDSRLADASKRDAFTLVELLTVMAIITLILTLLVPSVVVARSVARGITCRSNLRQIGVGLAANAETTGAYCSGSFDWRQDGAVVEYGWVADLVNRNVPVGEMLCPANPARLGATYNDLISMSESDFDPTLIDDAAADLGRAYGKESETAPDGRAIQNPCRELLVGQGDPSATLVPLPPGSPERSDVIAERILDKYYNTNYVATWYLVRAELNIDGSNGGNLSATTADTDFGLGVSNTNTLASNPCYTNGPLTTDIIDQSTMPTNTIPLVACARAVGTLAANVGPYRAGTPVAASQTFGPVVRFAEDTPYGGPRMVAPYDWNGTDPTAPLPAGTPRESGANPGWWEIWARNTAQDYRNFNPVHRRQCNVLFADGGVRPFLDANGDGYLNNGFSSDAGVFADSEIEMDATMITSRYSLTDRRLKASD